MKAKAKYRVSKKALWVAHKPGVCKGFGLTPKGALSDAIRKREDILSRNGTMRNLRNALLMEKEGRLMREDALRFEMLELRKKIEEESTDGWVMMACAFLGTADVDVAMKKMSALGITVGDRERAAAKRVDGLMERWEHRLKMKGVK